MSLSALDVTIVNTAIPTLIREFDTDHSSIQWVATSYLIALAISVPASGWLGDRYGTKRIYLLAIALFTVGSGLCGMANSVAEIVAFRTIQGIGGGMMVPVGIAMLWRAFPPEERARAARIIVLPTTIAPAMGRPFTSSPTTLKKLLPACNGTVAIQLFTPVHPTVHATPLTPMVEK